MTERESEWQDPDVEDIGRSDMDHPPTLEPVASGYIGYRAWLIFKGNLRSAYYGGMTSCSTLWECGERNEAYCFIKRHNVGVHDLESWKRCQCGYYGYWDLGVLLAERHKHIHAFVPPPHVVGAALFWGKTVEHEHGLRGQFAKPIALLSRDEAIAEKYDIPILPRRELEALRGY